jgi:hypothetical protein
VMEKYLEVRTMGEAQLHSPPSKLSTTSAKPPLERKSVIRDSVGARSARVRSTPPCLPLYRLHDSLLYAASFTANAPDQRRRVRLLVNHITTTITIRAGLRCSS